MISDAKAEASTTTDDDKQLILQAKKTLEYFLEDPDAPPILSHLVKQLQIPPGSSSSSSSSSSTKETYPPTVILLIVSLFALQKHSKLEQDLQQEKVLQVSHFFVLIGASFNLLFSLRLWNS